MATSTGRGGAGNIGAEEAKKTTPESLATPTLKGEVYTTGRGGRGNMAQNDPSNPAAARAAQDVEGPISTPESRGGIMHHGRGGAANVIKQTSSQDGTKKETEQSPKPKAEAKIEGSERKSRRPSSGLLERAKEGLERVRSGSSRTRKEPQELPKSGS